MSDFARLLCSSWRWGVTKNTGDVPLRPSAVFGHRSMGLYIEAVREIHTRRLWNFHRHLKDSQAIYRVSHE